MILNNDRLDGRVVSESDYLTKKKYNFYLAKLMYPSLLVKIFELHVETFH